MKKVLLFVAVLAAFNFTSCSDDEDGGGGSSAASRVKANIAGTEKIFDVVTVTEEPHDGYTDLRIKATTEEMPSDWIEIVVEKDAVGTEASWFFGYYISEFWHQTLPGWSTNVTENTSSKITGTFSGQVVKSDGTGAPIAITNGEFNINR